MDAVLFAFLNEKSLHETGLACSEEASRGSVWCPGPPSDLELVS